MDEIMKLKLAVKMKGNATPYEVDLMRYQQFRHVNDVLGRPLEESYQAQVIPNFKWAEWIDPAKVMPSSAFARRTEHEFTCRSVRKSVQYCSQSVRANRTPRQTNRLQDVCNGVKADSN